MGLILFLSSLISNVASNDLGRQIYQSREFKIDDCTKSGFRALIEQEKKTIPIVGIRTRYNLLRPRTLSSRQVQSRDP